MSLGVKSCWDTPRGSRRISGRSTPPDLVDDVRTQGAFQLGSAECRLDVANPVVVAEFELLVVPTADVCAAHERWVAGYAVLREQLMRRASFGSFVATAPPSPVVTVFTDES